MNPLKSHLPILWVDIANTFQQINQKSITSFKMLSIANPQVLFKNLPRLGKDLDSALETGLFTLTPGNFKKVKGACYPVFLQEYFKQIFWKEGYLKHDFDPSILRELRTLCFLFYKFEVPFSEEERTKACEKFKTVDSLVKTSFTDEQTSLLKEGIASLLPDDPFDIRPRHSGGSTADGYSNIEKRLLRRYIPSLMKVYGPEYFFNTLSHAKAWTAANPGLEPIEPCSKVTFVPKDSRGPRTICMEPHERMFIQKGIMHKLYDHIEMSSPAKGRINFTDQTINQRLSYESSMTRLNATIDLKDASDMVSWELVRQVFPHDWVVALEATRSANACLPTGEVIALNKFAPMGSALCFPIEAIVFYTIARLVTDEVWVYGDDIIVPTVNARDVMDLLETYGLLVNRDKSFYKGFFRESCGGDYYRGVNITPIRCKSVDLVSVYALANLLAEAFSPSTGEAVCVWYESIVSDILLRLPVSYKQANLLAFFTDRNNEYLLCKRRYNSDLQKYELKGLGQKQRVSTYHRQDDKGYDMLFDYFTNSLSDQAPMSDRYYRDLNEPYKKASSNTGKPLSGFIDKINVSTSSVFSTVVSHVGFTWVDQVIDP